MNCRLTFSAALVAGAFAISASSAEPPVGTTVDAQPLAIADYKAILENSQRPAEDKVDDAARKPAEVLTFSQVRRGETILELQAGRGWFSEILSGAIGPNGKLIIQRPPQMAASLPALKARIDSGRIKNSVLTITTFDKLDVADASVDRVLWFLGPHELYYTPKDHSPFALGDVKKTYAEIRRVLKPGGTFVVLDHAADTDAPTSATQTIHRIDPARVLGLAKEAGFELVERSSLLANPNDDRTKPAFDATVKRRTDQFLFRFQKPR